MLEKVCEYLYYNQKHAKSKEVSDMEIPPELCLELLIAADYLDGEFDGLRCLGCFADCAQYEGEEWSMGLATNGCDAATMLGSLVLVEGDFTSPSQSGHASIIYESEA